MGANISDGFELKRCDRAVSLGAHLAMIKGGLPGIVEAVMPCMFEFNRAPGFLCQERGKKKEGLVARVAAAELTRPHIC